MDDPDLLYEDLFEDLEDGNSVIKTSLHEMEDRMKILSNEAEELRLQVRNLQEQNDGLSKQNEILIRNISCLFKTAQMEISRKDKQIRSLQEESRKLKAFNSESPDLTASAQAAVARENKPYLIAMASQADGKTGEASTTCGMGKQGVHGGKHGNYASTESRRGSKDKMGEKPGKNILASNGAWKQNNRGDAQCNCVALEIQTDCKDDIERTPLASDGMRRRCHHRNGHQDYATMTSEANLKGRIREKLGGTEKQSRHVDDHYERGIKASQADQGKLSLTSGGIGKPGKSANLERQGDYEESSKEMPLGSIGSEKPGYHDDSHGDCTSMASRADCKGSEKETFLTSSGIKNEDHQRDDHRDHLERCRSCGKSGEPPDEMWKRRRSEGEYVAAGNEYHRRRADERYLLEAKRGERAINGYRSLDAHKAFERREKWNYS